jgi:hypothetical protein
LPAEDTRKERFFDMSRRFVWASVNQLIFFFLRSDFRRQVDLVIVDRSLPPTPNAVKGFPRPCDAENTSYPLASNAAEDLELAIFRLRRNQSSSPSNSELHGALLPFKHLAIVNTINIHNRTGYVVGTIPQ